MSLRLPARPFDYQALAEFRYQIRRFVHFSEKAARAAKLAPQQHQVLLAVKALSQMRDPTIRELAGRLLLRHNSAVELVDRLAARGMVRRVRSTVDRRQVWIRITARGDRVLHRLSLFHLEQLRSTGPALVQTLRGLLPHPPATRR